MGHDASSFLGAPRSFRERNPHLFPQRPPESPAVRLEADLRGQVEKYCRDRGWLFITARTDAPSTIGVGMPDYAVFMSGARAFFAELKRPGGKATTDQLAKLAHARKLGFAAGICESLRDFDALATAAASQKLDFH